MPRKLQLRSEVSLSRDLVTFGDLIPGLTGEAATTAAFRAPGLGETGTIQVTRVVEAARAAGIVRETSDLDNQGFAQVVVTRAARRITAADIEIAVKIGLRRRRRNPSTASCHVSSIQRKDRASRCSAFTCSALPSASRAARRAASGDMPRAS